MLQMARGGDGQQQRRWRMIPFSSLMALPFDGVDGFEISVSEGYRRKTFWWLEVDKVEIEIFDGVEMTFSGLVR